MKYANMKKQETKLIYDFSYGEFKKLVCKIYELRKKSRESLNLVTKAKCRKSITLICQAIEKALCDKDRNFVRWLKGEECIYIVSRNRKRVNIQVRKNIETIYYFLKYCMKINRFDFADETLEDYLAYLLCEPCSGGSMYD